MNAADPSAEPPGQLSADRMSHIQRRLLAWFKEQGRDLPWRHTRDPYHILVAEIMLQQTQVERVKPKYDAFLKQFPSLAALAAASPGDVIRAWSGLGYNRRALNLQRTAQAVLADYNGRFPDTPAALRELPGIGPYTAGAVACFAFERDVAFMDTNIRRVLQRLFVGPHTAPTAERALQLLAEAAVPDGQGWSWNQAIMELGALICTATRPRCQICPLRSDCHAYSAWSTADAAVFAGGLTYAATSKATRKVAERPAPFTATSRYFRGRAVEILRQLPPGTWLSLGQLGPHIKSEWTTADVPWLIKLLQGLADDGLVVLDGEAQQVRLP